MTTSVPTRTRPVVEDQPRTIKARPIDLINYDIGQFRHNPFECIGLTSGVPHKWKGHQKLNTAEEPLNDFLRCERTVLCNPALDVFEIRDCFFVEDKLHRFL